MRWKDIEQLQLEPIDFGEFSVAVYPPGVVLMAAKSQRYYQRKDIEPIIFGEDNQYIGLRILSNHKERGVSVVDSEIMLLYENVYIVRSRWLSRYHSSSAVWLYQKLESGWKRIRLNKEIRSIMNMRLATLVLTDTPKQNTDDLPF